MNKFIENYYKCGRVSLRILFFAVSDVKKYTVHLNIYKLGHISWCTCGLRVLIIVITFKHWSSCFAL